MKKQLVILGLAAFASLVSRFAWSAESTPYELKDVGIQEHLGETISLDNTFTDETGKEVALSSFFQAKHPVVISLVYYSCPNLCTLVLNGLTEAINQSDWQLGKQYEIVSVSIDPQNTPDLAAAKKTNYLSELKNQPNAAAHWHFLTSKEENVRKLANELGFGYAYDKNQGEYAHAAALFVLTPGGKISRYLYGIQYNPRDFRLSLLEASEGKIGTLIDKLLLYCYHYDPMGKKYALFALNLMKLGGALTVIGIVGLLLRLRKASQRKESC